MRCAARFNAEEQRPAELVPCRASSLPLPQFRFLERGRVGWGSREHINGNAPCSGHRVGALPPTILLPCSFYDRGRLGGGLKCTINSVLGTIWGTLKIRAKIYHFIRLAWASQCQESLAYPQTAAVFDSNQRHNPQNAGYDESGTGLGRLSPPG